MDVAVIKRAVKIEREEALQIVRITTGEIVDESGFVTPDIWQRIYDKLKTRFPTESHGLFIVYEDMWLAEILVGTTPYMTIEKLREAVSIIDQSASNASFYIVDTTTA